MQKNTPAKSFKTKGLSKVVVCSLTTGTDAVEKRGIVAKMMKAWEAKATKRAANATGFTLMAVSLAACNDSTADTSVADAALATLRTDLGVADDATTTEMMNAVTALEDAASSAAAANAVVQTALANLRTDLGVASDATTTEMISAITALETGSAEGQTALAALRTDLGVAADASTADMISAITALETGSAEGQTALTALRTDLGVAADASTADMISAITALETTASNVAAARDTAQTGLASLRTDLGLAADASTADMISAITGLETAATDAAAARDAATSSLAALRTDLDLAVDATTADMISAITALETGSAEGQTALAALRTDLGVAADASTADMISAITALETGSAEGQTALTALRTDLGVAADASTADMILAITALETAAANAANDAVLALGITGVSTLADLAAAYDALVNPIATTFTLTADTALLTSSAASDVVGTGFLTAGDDTINANTRLADGVYIEDASSTDNDVLNATLLAPGAAPTPTLINIETLNLQSAVAGGKLSMAATVGTDTVNIGGSNSVALSGVVQDGSVEFVLSTNKAVSLEGLTTSAATDTFNVVVNGATTAGGSFTFSDSDAGSAVAIAEVNVSSLGDAANVLNLVSVSANDYTGITALNITGAADLTLTTDYAVKSDIDASELTGELSLNLRGMSDAAADFADLITGSVANLTLSAYAMTSAKSVDTTAIDGLQTVNLSPTAVAVDSVSLKVNAGVDVNLIGSNGTDGVAAIVATGASTGTNDSLELGIGGEAAVEFATVTAAGVENLSLSSTTSSATAVSNTIAALGASAASGFTTITIDASEKANISVTDTFVKTGTATATNVASFVTSGAGDIALGTVQVTATSPTDGLTNINEINLSSSGAGDRSFTIGEAGDLKATASASQAAGTGVVLSGDGTGTVTVAGAAAIFDTLKINAADFAGTTAVSTNATTGAINAANFTGVDELIYTGVRASDGVINLGAGTVVVSTAASATLVAIGNRTGVTENSVKFAHDAGDAGIGTLTANGAATLNIVTDQGERTAADAMTVGTLNATSATEINITADEFASVALTNAYTTLTPTVGKRDVVFNLTGDGAIDFVGGITATALDTLTINASGDGARAIGTLTASDLVSGSELRLTGDQDLLIDALTIVAADGEIVKMSGSGDITITATTATTVADAKTLTFDLTSTAGGETVTFTDASTIDIGAGSTIAISGNKDVVIGSSSATGLIMGATGSAHDESVLDASGLSGDLTAFILDNEGADTDVATIKLGTGESTISLSGAGSSAARIDDDAVFTILFNDDGIADTSITGFLATASAHNDILSFDGSGFGTADEIVSISASRSVVENATNVQILEITDVGSNLEITSLTGAFEGTITLVGVSNIGDLLIGNFDF